MWCYRKLKIIYLLSKRNSVFFDVWKTDKKSRFYPLKYTLYTWQAPTQMNYFVAFKQIPISKTF